MRSLGRTLAVLVAMVLLAASPAQADFGLNGFDVEFTEADGTAANRAGSHPFEMSTVFNINYHADPLLGPVPDQELKNLLVRLPAGFAGNPSATPHCSSVDLVTIDPATSKTSCPDESAVGAVILGITNPTPEKTAPVYNIDPPPGVAAQLGFLVERVPVTIDIPVNNGSPYNVSPMLINVPQAVKLFASKLIVWGNPANEAHDPFRGNCLDYKSTAAPPGGFGELKSVGNCPSSAPEKPFVTLPRACAGPLATTYSATSWQNPKGIPATGSSASPLQTEGCPLEFGPTADAKPTASTAESPSGLDFALDIDDPELTSPTGVADADIKKTVVTLPEGITTNPSVASGLSACTLAQYDSETVGSDPGTGCPESSKVGSVEVETPLLEGEVLRGSIFVAKQGDNPFGNLVTIYMVIKDPGLGILIRAAGKVDPDPVTGRLTTTFDDLPQLPYSHFRLHLRSGQRAPLITPPTCGSFTATADLYPYGDPAGPPVRETATFEINAGAGGSGCVADRSQMPNAPSFSAGTLSPLAGSYSPFVLRLAREDGSQQIASVRTTLPGGLLGRLAGIPYCPEAQIAQAASRGGAGQAVLEVASPSCPAASEVGTVDVGAGAGSSPIHVQGRVYLAGPYKGAPLSLAIVTPAIAGPFDLGVVVVRTALQVDPRSTQITAESDPIPTILHGLPLDVRSIAIDMSRPGFTLNPTSCEPKSIVGSAISSLGSVAPLSQYFQASDCGALKFKPKLAIKLTGKTRRSGHPALKAVVTYPKKGAYSNIARARVGLPRSAFLDQGNIRTVCTQPQLKSGTCPKASIYGRAKAWSPLLDKPLEGPVYLGVGYGHTLPDLVADLDGQIRVLLNGRIDTTPQGGIRSTFETVPDAPVSRFVLEMKGGPRRGLIENSENLCSKAQKAKVTLTAHNGRIAQERTSIGNDCGRKTKGKKQPK